MPTAAARQMPESDPARGRTRTRCRASPSSSAGPSGGVAPCQESDQLGGGRIIRPGWRSVRHWLDHLLGVLIGNQLCDSSGVGRVGIAAHRSHVGFLSTKHLGVWRSWQRTCFGSTRSSVRVRPPRPSTTRPPRGDRTRPSGAPRPGGASRRPTRAAAAGAPGDDPPLTFEPSDRPLPSAAAGDPTP